MKSLLLKVGLLTCLLLGLVYEETSASSEWSSKCSKFSAIKEKENPDFQHINCLLTNAALDAEIPPEVVKAVAMKESDWLQFLAPGKPNVTSDGGIGIMQVTDIPKEYNNEEKSKYKEKLSYDIVFNIEEGVKILSKKFDYGQLPKIQGAGRQEIENWYFPIMAYNGTKATNGPVYQSNGLRNPNAYQEIVFSNIEKGSFLNDTKLALFPFKTEHFSYNANNNINFLKDTFILTDPLYTSSYQLKPGDDVVVTGGNVSLREKPTTSKDVNNLAPRNVVLKITGEFTYEIGLGSVNQFVWFPVKTKDGKEGFISSAYIKKLDSAWTSPVDNIAPTIPSVNEVTDKMTKITGKSEPSSTLIAKVGSTVIGTAKTNADSTFTVSIKKQKAGTTVIVQATDDAGNKSEAKKVTVKDVTAPTTPVVNAIADNVKVITGKAESNATVYALAGNKKIGKVNAKNGAFKIEIAKKQKAGTAISVYSVDAAKNKSKSKTVKVIDKTAPNQATVNKVTSKTLTVTGKAEKGASVTIYNGSKKLGQEKVDNRGTYKVKIKVQKKGSLLKVSVQDKSGNKSSKSVSVK